MRRMYSKKQIERIVEEHTGAVSSVNGKVGEVVINGTDIKLTTNQQTVQNNIIRIDETLDTKLDANKQAISTAGGLVVPTTAPTETILTGITEDREQVQVKLGDGLTLSGSTSPFTLSAVGTPSVDLYKHNIRISAFGSSNMYIYFQLITNDSTPLTFPTLLSELPTIQNNAWLGVNGVIKNTNQLVFGINKYTSTQMGLQVYNITEHTFTTLTTGTESINVHDDVSNL